MSNCENDFEDITGSDYSSDSEDIDDQKVIASLETIIENIRNGTFPDRIKKDVYESVREYIGDPSQAELDPDVVKYLFRGWFVSQNLPPVEDFPVCPLCVQVVKK